MKRVIKKLKKKSKNFFLSLFVSIVFAMVIIGRMGGINWGEIHFFNDKISRAERSLKRNHDEISSRPFESFPLYHRGRDYMVLGKYKLAIKDFEKSIELGAKDISPILEISKALVGLNKEKEALALISNEIKKSGKYLSLHQQRAYCYDSLENFSKAIKDYSFYIYYDSKKDPMSEHIFNLKRRAIMYMGLKDYTNALTDIDAAILLNELYNFDYPEYEDKVKDLYPLKGFVLYSVGKTDKAKEFIEKGMDENDEYPLAYLYLALIYSGEGKAEKAEDMLKKSIEYGYKDKEFILSNDLLNSLISKDDMDEMFKYSDKVFKVMKKTALLPAFDIREEIML